MNLPASRSVTAAIEKLLKFETRRPERDAYERELELYMAAGDEKRRVIDHRLLAFADLPSEKDRTMADISTIATRLGGAQSNVYRLLKRIRTHGPVSGLMPRNKLKPKSGVATEGFGEPVDGWILQAIESRPEITISEMARVLSSNAKLLKADDTADAVKVPSLASVRRRIQALRTEGKTGSLLELLGRSLLIDQCPTDIIVKVPLAGSRRSEIRRVSVAMVVDVPSSTVLGVGAFIDGNALDGLALALRNLRTRVTMLALDGVWFAGPPSEIRWMVPDDLVPFARVVADRASSADPSVDLACHVVEDGRQGRELYRILGGRIGHFELLARSSAEVEGSSPDIARRPTDEDIFTLSGAQSALQSATMRRDRAKINSIPKPRPKRLGTAAAFREAVEHLFEEVSIVGTKRRRSQMGLPVD